MPSFTAPAIEFRSDMTVELIDSMGSDQRIADAARVSTGTDGEPVTQGFIDFLLKNRHGCYDSDTEVLTKRGWIPWSEATANDQFMTVDPATGKKEWQLPLRVIHKPWRGKMVKVNTGLVDLLVTPDHRMMRKARSKEGWGEWGMGTADEMLNRTVRLPLGVEGEWLGETFLDPSKAALLGFIIGDGYVGKTSISVRIKKERKIDWLESAVADAGYTLSRYSDGITFGILGVDEEFRSLAEQTYLNGDRVIPQAALNAQEDALYRLLEGLIESDGYRGDKGRVHFSTVSSILRDQVQELVAKLGGSASYSVTTPGNGHYGTQDIYSMVLRSDRVLEPRIGWTLDERSEQVTEVDYNGEVHCATVPSGVLYVRRNGNPIWCGNSPFEHPQSTFRIECPIFVAREFMRHRIASYNEESGRYKKLEPVFYIPAYERKLVQVGKPGAYEFEYGNDSQSKLTMNQFVYIAREAYDSYEAMLEEGIAREVARMVLPLNIYTSFYVTMNARGLMNFLSLRNKTEDTTVPTYPQREIEMVAEQMEAEFSEKLPMTYTSFINNGRIAP